MSTNIINNYEITSIHTDRNSFTYTLSPLGTPCWEQCGEGHIDFLRFETAEELISEAKRNLESIHVSVKGVEGLVELSYPALEEKRARERAEIERYVQNVINTRARIGKICSDYLAA
jgi:hypothetical protein